MLQLLFSYSFLLLLAGLCPARADSWQQRAPVPGPRAAHSAVWTGSELIVWGGGIDGYFLDTGARYTPSTDAWSMTSTRNAPSPRWFHAAVWTGNEMILWGGRPNFFSTGNLSDGARYDPATDTWKPMSNEGAPARRSQCVAVWSGSEMIVWGGETEGGVALADGARYNPATDTWAPMNPASGLEPRMEPTGVWTGSELIIFGGVDATTPGWTSYGTGARYNPATDSWALLPTEGAPGSRTGHTAVWTGERMIVWGGRALPADEYFNDGALYNPGSDQWTPISLDDAPLARMLHAGVWTGSEMIVWGGVASPGSLMLDTGARYNPSTGVWQATTQANAPGKRMFWRPDLGIWTGGGMLVCAGSDYPASLDSTYLYTLTDPPCPPVIREQPQSISAIADSPVTLAVGAQDCAAGPYPSSTQVSLGPEASSFEFETGARAGQLQFTYDFLTVPDSLRVYYEGRRIYDNSLSGEGILRVPFGPGSAHSVHIVVNEDGGPPNTVWEYTVSFRPPPLTYQWQKDGIALEGQTGPTLHFPGVSPEDAGDYAAVVTQNNVAVISAVATITVLPAPPANCVAVPPGLVAWWRGEGNAIDETGAHDGTLLFGTTFAPGVVGQAFGFDLSRARVSIPDADAFKLTESLSFEGWINVASAAPGIIFIRGDNRPGLDPYHMAITSAGQVHWGIINEENTFIGVVSPEPLVMGVWVHVAGVLDGATGDLSLYVNGALASQIQTDLRPLRDLDPDWEPALGIGNAGGTFHHFPFHGSVEEWALYSRALSAEEIQAIYNAGAAGKCPIHPPPPPPTYDLSRDFSLMNNPNGPWSYGYQSNLGGGFTLLEFPLTSYGNNPVPVDSWSKNGYEPVAVYHNGSTETSISDDGAGTFPPGTTWFYPGVEGNIDNYGVIRFIVPAGGAGVYQLETAVRAYLDGPRSGDTDFHVLRNGIELFGEFVPGNAATGYSNRLSLAEGDTVDFAVGRGQDNIAYDSGLKIQIALNAIAQSSISVDAVSFLASGANMVTGHAPPGTICRVERSTNLVDWVQVGTAVEVAEGIYEFIDAKPPGGPVCIYRFLGIEQ